MANGLYKNFNANPMKMLPLLFSPAGKNARLSIVIYHRVLPKPDPLLGGSDVESFETELKYLTKNFNILPLSEAVKRLRSGTLPSRAVSITFDDGYADNAEIALPILLKYGITATFFVASGFLDGGRMWNDTVIESIRQVQGEVLDLNEIDLGTHAMTSLDERRRALSFLIGALKYLPQEARQSQVEKVRALISADLPDNLMMTSDQVRQLHHAGMEIGGHTINHPILTSIGNAAARTEIAEGKEILEGIIRAPVRLFAYPNGKPGKDYQVDHVNMVRQLGFDAAVSTAWGAARDSDDCFQLPRFTPWDKSEFFYVSRMVRNIFHKIEVA
ncbi:Peptidoglycan/xylan/chitin deacetylase, PgdA/CDA1 family [Nitrosomonas sp. Nm58]|nr:Peptidoglycan/xylan/chitin deacetylase, PgdA/CDA1 family [Nitrosomonas sp. Nm58]